MADWDNIILFDTLPERPQKVSLGDSERWAANEARSIVNGTLPRFMNSFFEHLDDALYDFADKVSGGQSGNYLGAMRDIRKLRSRIEQSFRQRILTRYDQFWDKGPVDSGEEGGETDLSLVAVEDLEENLAISNMVSKAENRFHLELYSIEQRFGHMLGGAEVTNRTNPISPAALCGAFCEATQYLPMDTAIRVVVYKLFDNQVMRYVGGMYDEINALLGRIGILPRLTPQCERNPVAPSITALDTPASPAAAARDAAEAVTPGLDTSLFSTLRSLLQQRRGSVSAAVSPHARAIETDSLLGALSELQQHEFAGVTSDDEMVRDAEQLKQQLLDRLRVGAIADNGTLSRVDTDTIDVMGMLFEFILGDPNLPEAMKVLLGRLQIPMVKVALLDKTYFSNPDHPARRLLNRLARAASAWSDDGDRSQNSLYGQIELAVNRVLVEYRKEASLFEELDTALAGYLDREQHAAEVAEERITQVTRGKEQLAAAKARVAEEIGRRRKTKNLPPVVVSILQGGWNDVLLLTYLRQGPDSSAWETAVSLMDKLIWSVQVKTAYQERQELLRCIPGLLDALRSGLAGIAFDVHKMSRLFNELQACHIACLRDGVDPKHRRSASDTVQTDDGFDSGTGSAPADQQPDEGDAGQDWDDARRQAEDMHVGDWYEFETDTGSAPFRAKLAWKSDISGTRLFVDRRGAKALEATTEDLAGQLRKGSVRFLTNMDVPFMDRAMESLVADLKSTSH